MSYQRKPLSGQIVLKNIVYTIHGIEKEGSGSIVYRASCEGAGDENRHPVLMGELYPHTADGGIDRGENGRIGVTAERRSLFDDCRDRFLSSAKANGEALGGGGRVVEAYGTCYSLWPAEGAKSLHTLLREGRRYTLREAAVLLRELTRTLQRFHERGLLHLDISPETVFPLGEGVLLTDVNGAPQTREPDTGVFPLRIGGRYSAPELRLGCMEEVGCATDLYSVCAVFFRLLVERPLRGSEVFGNGLPKCLAGELPVLLGMPVSAGKKAVRILSKGLSTLGKQRYGDCGALLADLEELIFRIDRHGVTQSALVESSRALCRQLTGGREDNSSEAAALAALPGESSGGGRRLLLCGSSGGEKTALLTALWQRRLRQAPRDVTLYLPLKDCGDGEGSIRRAILRHVSYPETARGYEAALRSLEELLSGEDGGPGLLLLLDGLSASGEKRKLLLRELRELSGYVGVGFLLTDDAEDGSVPEGFTPIAIKPRCDGVDGRRTDVAFSARERVAGQHGFLER